MHLRRETLGAPVERADPAILSALEPYAERRWPNRAKHSALVADLVAARLEDIPTLRSVCRALALSPQALQLRLAEEATTYSAIVDRVQREQALLLLTTSDLRITTIATRVGFSSPAGLTRAVRRWTDLSPTEYRRRRARGREVAERDRGIGEQGGFDRTAPGDDGLEVVDDVPDVDVHGRGDHVVAQPEGDELAGVAVAAHDHRVVGVAVPDVLEADFVLVGEEVGQPIVGLMEAGGVAAGGAALVEGVGPVLGAHVAVVVRVPGVGDVAGGVDARDGGLEVLVDDDAVVDMQAGRPCEFGAGVTPTPTTTTSAASARPSLSTISSTVSAPRSSLTPVPGRSVTPLSACSRRNTSPISSPTMRCSGVGAGPIRVTSAPIWRAGAATSEPIQPAPMTATRVAVRMASWRRTASSMVRR